MWLLGGWLQNKRSVPPLVAPMFRSPPPTFLGGRPSSGVASGANQWLQKEA